MSRIVHFKDAVVLLGTFPALAGTTFEIAAGETVLLRGANGAGKTTLLRAIAGLVPVVEGVAGVLGHDLRAQRRAVRKHVAYLGHASGLYDELSVADNLTFRQRAARANTALIADACGRVGVEHRLLTVPAGKLSAGQRRRVALAALIAQRAPLWLLDEPHASLDTEGQDRLDHVIRQALLGGTTVIFASHEVERSTRLATAIIEVRGGTTRTVEGHPHEGTASAPLAGVH